MLRIFTDYVERCLTPREIAKALNADGIKPPRGRTWNASTINGNQRRGNGMLLNPLYAGQLVWNKVAMPKRPGTDKRVVRPNAREAWVTQAVPELAIVPLALFEAAQRRKADRAIGHSYTQRRPRHLLSGLLRCACCGGGLVAFGKARSGRRRLHCSTHREFGSCSESRTFYLDVIEAAVLGALRTELQAPAVIAESVKAYHEERQRLAAGAGKRRARTERRVNEIEREIARLVDAIAKGLGDAEILGARMKEIVAERRAFEAELNALPAEEKIVSLHPGVLARYERALDDLQSVLTASTAVGDHGGAAALRELVETVVVARDETRPRGIMVVITGRLKAILGAEASPDGVCISVVAGAGIEPATYGL